MQLDVFRLSFNSQLTQEVSGVTGLGRELSWGWEPDPLRIELALSEVMFDLDPGWNQWVGLEVGTP